MQTYENYLDWDMRCWKEDKKKKMKDWKYYHPDSFINAVNEG